MILSSSGQNIDRYFKEDFLFKWLVSYDYSGGLQDYMASFNMDTAAACPGCTQSKDLTQLDYRNAEVGWRCAQKVAANVKQMQVQ